MPPATSSARPSRSTAARSWCDAAAGRPSDSNSNLLVADSCFPDISVRPQPQSVESPPHQRLGVERSEHVGGILAGLRRRWPKPSGCCCRYSSHGNSSVKSRCRWRCRPNSARSGSGRDGSFSAVWSGGNSASSSRSSSQPSPSGHPKPAACIRARYSCTVLWLTFALRTIFRWPSFCSKWSRRVSLILRMDFLCLGNLISPSRAAHGSPRGSSSAAFAPSQHSTQQPISILTRRSPLATSTRK